MTENKYVGYIKEIVKPVTGLFVLIFILIELEHIINFAGPYMSKLIFDRLLIMKDYQGVVWILTVYILFYLYSECHLNIQSYITQMFLENSEKKFREKCMTIHFRKTLTEFKKHSFGDVSTILETNIRDTIMYLITIVDTLFGHPLFLILSFGYIFGVSPLLLSLIVVEALISFILIRAFTNPLERAYDRKLQGKAQYSRHLEKTYNAYEDSRLNLISNISLVRLFKVFALYRSRNLKDKGVNSVYHFLQEFKGVLFDIGALVITIRLVHLDVMTVGDYVAYIALKPCCYGVFNRFTHLILSFRMLKVAIDGIDAIIPFQQYRNFQEFPDSAEKCERIKSIRLSGIHFQYKADQPLFVDFNLEFKTNQMYTIMGGNGVGKTTLLRLLTGVCRPDQGRILINGDKDISSFSENILTRRMKVLSQNPVLYDDTIEQNINILGSSRSSIFERYEEMKKLFRFDEIFSQYKDADRSNIFDESVSLSGGQIKKIGLARTLIYDSDVLIFDEPFAALDPDSRKQFTHYLLSNAQDRIIIIITHQLECALGETEIRLLAERDKAGMVQFKHLER